jgi:hypothetical protein
MTEPRKWTARKAVRALYVWALAHPHAVVTYATAVYLTVHRAGL